MNIRRRITLLIPIISLFCTISFVYPVYAQDNFTGTYTNLYFNEEGGDLLGEELKIVVTGKGYQGILQIAEGGGGELAIVDIVFDKNTIKFTIPESSSDAGTFDGTITKKSIKGKLRFKSGGEKTVTLKKGQSYWDR